MPHGWEFFEDVQNMEVWVLEIKVEHLEHGSLSCDCGCNEIPQALHAHALAPFWFYRRGQT